MGKPNAPARMPVFRPSVFTSNGGNAEVPPAGHVSVDVTGEVADWIQEHPGMWQGPRPLVFTAMRHRFIITDELYTLLVLKWS